MSATLAGYCDPFCVRAGGEIGFMLHAEIDSGVEIDVVRIVHGDRRSEQGLILQPVSNGLTGTYRVRPQPIACGSYGIAGEGIEAASLHTYGFGCALYLTTNGRRQCVMSIAADLGASLYVDERGRLGASLIANGGRVELMTEKGLALDTWYFVGVCIDAQKGRATVFARPVAGGHGRDEHAAQDVPGLDGSAAAPVMFAGRRSGATLAITDCLDGRLDSPRFLSGEIRPDDLVAAILACDPREIAHVKIVGFWDFGSGQDTRAIVDRGPAGMNGRLCNLPARACTGFRWCGKTHDWRVAPMDYGAIHFHADAVYDLGWQRTLCWKIPEDLRSGAYALRLKHSEETAYVTFFVSPASERVAPVVFLASTATYLAYANETVHLRLPEMLYGVRPQPSAEDRLLLKYPEFGGSLYESYRDGRGVRYSSWLRPLLNVRPDARMWSFNADTAILHWLESQAPQYDLVTDHDIQSRGASALDGARVVVTGTHPEYCSGEMLDALEAFLGRGGRLMYMGGNGFYWRTAFSGAWPAAIEVRRAEDGTRAWIEEPAEYHAAFDGELGGLWRRLRRPPNRLVGVGFAAQGFTTSNPYHVAADARRSRAAFILEGVEADVIGAFGNRGGGAAGEEIDRYDAALGSPCHAVILASSRDHAPDMLRVKEELHTSAPFGPDPDVRADLVFFETAAGGAVFSTGSIAWAGALGAGHYNNDIARISTNVLRRFSDPAPFAVPTAGDET